jgi:1-acyl-sn-glycerol-3-phosphate acyltransferase
MWVSNHVSWLDPLVLMSLRPSGALAKAEVADYPIIGRGATKLGLAFVKREDPLSRAAAIVRIAHEVRNGRQFLVFPEGTTTRGEGLAPLQEGSLRAAYRLDVTVLPIHLSSPDSHYPWVGDAALLPHIWNLAKADGTKVRVEGRQVLRPWQFSNEEAWLEGARQALMP